MYLNESALVPFKFISLSLPLGGAFAYDSSKPLNGTDVVLESVAPTLARGAE